MTNDQRELFRLLLVRLLETAASDHWTDEQLVEVILDLESYIDELIEQEIFTLLNTLQNHNYGVN
jgi:hypothetical protein